MALNKNIISNNFGGVLILIALMLPLLMIILGVALQTGRLYVAQAEAQTAADAALLGAVSTSDTTDVTSEAKKLFFANYPAGYMGTNITDGNINVSVISTAPSTAYAMTVSFPVPNFFSGLVGPASTNITVSTQAVKGVSCPPATICNNQVELALVLDNSGSMSQIIDGSTTKMQALQSSATELVNILFGGASTLPNLHISLIPYDTVVQIGTGHGSWMQTSQPSPTGAPSPYTYGPYPTTTTNSSLAKYNSMVGSGGSGENFINSIFSDAIAAATGTSGLGGGTGKGFAANRETDFQCGWYYYKNTCPGQANCAVMNPTACAAVPSCTAGTSTCPQNYTTCGDTFHDYCSISHSACSPATATTDCPPQPTTDSEGNITYTNQTCVTQCTPCTAGLPTCTAKCTVANHTTNNCGENGLNDIDDTPPTAGANYLFRLPYENYYPEPNAPSEGVGSPGNAYDHKYITNLAPLLFASSNSADIRDAISSMQVSGNTRINVGLMWGWFTLSQKWQGVWSAGQPTLPLPFGPTNIKQLVLLTDGYNDELGNIASSITTDNAKTTALCNAIKQEGITIYTIAIGPPGGYDQALLQGCASEPTYFFVAPTAAQLSTVFEQISDDILSITEHLTQ